MNVGISHNVWSSYWFSSFIFTLSGPTAWSTGRGIPQQGMACGAQTAFAWQALFWSRLCDMLVFHEVERPETMTIIENTWSADGHWLNHKNVYIFRYYNKSVAQDEQMWLKRVQELISRIVADSVDLGCCNTCCTDIYHVIEISWLSCFQVYLEFNFPWKNERLTFIWKTRFLWFPRFFLKFLLDIFGVIWTANWYSFALLHHVNKRSIWKVFNEDTVGQKCAGCRELSNSSVFVFEFGDSDLL